MSLKMFLLLELPFQGNVKFDSTITDDYGNVGAAGSVLASTSTNLQWSAADTVGSGAQGIQGIQGPSDGADGAQGTQGIQGLQGTAGVVGSDGNDGAQGVQGIQGPADGPQGTTGTQGTQGIQGTQGTQGTQGLIGTQGLQGIRVVFSHAKTTVNLTATAGQTTFTTSYVVGFVDVYLNGIRLGEGEFTASNGTSYCS